MESHLWAPVMHTTSLQGLGACRGSTLLWVAVIWSKTSNTPPSAAQGAAPSPTPPGIGSSLTKEWHLFQPHSGFPSQGLIPFFFILVFGDDSPLPSSYVSKTVTYWEHGNGHML